MLDARWFLFAGGLLLWLAGCSVNVDGQGTSSGHGGDTVAEGTIFNVKYDLGDGKVGGFTRYDNSAAVPGGNGSWNVDAQGKLTSKFLVITYANRAALGPHVIPVDRLYEVQFGNGGLVQVSHPDQHDHQPHQH